MADFAKFSLDYLRPSAAGEKSVTQSSDPWAVAVDYYGTPVQEILRDEGRKTVEELYQFIKKKLEVPQLQLEQFSAVIERMIREGRLSVVKRGDSFANSFVALPVPKP